MLGTLGLLILNAQKVSNYVKENISIQLFLKENVKEADVLQLTKALETERYVKSTKYISKDEAAEIVKEDVGRDFVEFLGFNPLSASVDINLQGEYAVPDSIQWIEKELLQNQFVQEVHYRPDLVEKIAHNINRITLVVMAFSAILLLIAIALINNTIRLSIYSKRFLIRSMQLVGATGTFIQRPFLWRGLLQGVYGAFIAIILISGVIYLAQQHIPGFFDINDVEVFALIFAGVTLLGIFISFVSTYFAVRRYLRMNPDNLF